ncbi:hypothetical protein D3C76_1820520 [compost metagenome]
MFVIASQFVLNQIQSQVSAAKLRMACACTGASKQRVKTCNHLDSRKGFCQIVIAASPQALNALIDV